MKYIIISNNHNITAVFICSGAHLNNKLLHEKLSIRLNNRINTNRIHFKIIIVQAK